MNYYNDNDKHSAQWLRNLIDAGLIPPGDVDERNITDVRPEDVRSYTQCHFFAGIGGWSRALQLAGWDPARPVWTGSLPCQPFSTAGKRGGESDERHLWPEFQRLIAECQPPVVFGEQVASGLGREWLSRVRSSLETMGYGVGAADLCAAGVGAPHIRQRLYWVADSDGDRAPERYVSNAKRGHIGEIPRGRDKQSSQDESAHTHNSGASDRVAESDGGMADTDDAGRRSGHGEAPDQGREVRVRRSVDLGDSGEDGMADSERGELQRWGGSGELGVETTEEHREVQERQRAGDTPIDSSTTGGVADASGGGRREDRQQAELRTGGVEQPPGPAWVSREGADAEVTRGGRADDELIRMEQSEGNGRVERGAEPVRRGVEQRRGGFGDTAWSDSEWITFRDGKQRRSQPGTSPLVTGVPFRLADGRSREDVSRIELIRGIGNAIVPPLAAAFIRAYMETAPR